MKPLISVVVPFYNIGRLISDTLASVAAQDYENIEIILVDDASVDDTADIARLALENSGRPWRVVRHAANRGVSAARNTGMGIAKGEYIHFMDADDLVEKSFISALHEAISREDGDIAFCGFRSREMSTGQEIERPVRLDPGRRHSPEDITLMRIFKTIDPTIWTMLFRTAFLRSCGVRSAEDCSHGQDVEFVIDVLSQAGKIAFSPKCLYVYRLHDNMTARKSALSRETAMRHYEDFTEAHFRMADFLARRSNSPKIKDAAECFLLPTAYIKRLNILSWRGDREKFDETINAPRVRGALKSSRKYFLKKPEVFVKALWLLYFPDSYFRFRAARRC